MVFNVRRVEVLIHPTCTSSYNLVKELSERGLLSKLVLRAAEEPIYTPKYRAFSVPWVIAENTSIMADPVSISDVEAILEEKKIEPIDPYTALKNTTLHSGYLSSVAALLVSLKPVLTRDVISVATRSPFDRSQCR